MKNVGNRKFGNYASNSRNHVSNAKRITRIQNKILSKKYNAVAKI